MQESINPYKAPTADISSQPFSPTVESEEVAIRRKHLSTEASLQAIGALYFVGGGWIFIGLAFALVGFIITGIDWFDLVFSILYLSLALLGIWLGVGLRRLDLRVRIPVIVISCIGLIAIPLGTILNAYILYLLLCKKGRYVFTPEYKMIIQQTPQIKYRTSILMWILLFIILGLLVGVVSFLTIG